MTFVYVLEGVIVVLWIVFLAELIRHGILMRQINQRIAESNQRVAEARQRFDQVILEQALRELQDDREEQS